MNALASDFVAMEFRDTNPGFGHGWDDDGGRRDGGGGSRGVELHVQYVNVLFEHGGNQLFPLTLPDLRVQVVDGKGYWHFERRRLSARRGRLRRR